MKKSSIVCLNLFVLACMAVAPALGQLTFQSMPELPAFKLADSKGQSFYLTDVARDKMPTVVIYFSPTCHHCQQQTEDITANYDMFKRARIIFITSYPPADYQPFLAQYAIEKFEHIRFGYDSTFAVGKFYMLQSIPGVFVYDVNRKLKTYFTTNVKPDALHKAIFE